jgi:two-component system, NtrC family, nitrogen regulation response regulator NtrX
MRRTILIVDDEESICQSLTGILSDEGYEVVSAGSGEDALRMIEEELPSVILLDI